MTTMFQKRSENIMQITSSLICWNTKTLTIFDILNVACKAIQQLATVAADLFYFILMQNISTREMKKLIEVADTCFILVHLYGGLYIEWVK